MHESTDVRLLGKSVHVLEPEVPERKRICITFYPSSQRNSTSQPYPISDPKFLRNPTPSASNTDSYICSIGSSSNKLPLLPLPTFLSFGKSALIGTRTRSLKRNVPYTSKANPTTCSHLKVSQPRPRETIQIKSVRQVSIVEREVALTVRVTERPKKLKPLL
jgi:hypothetical protein